jgi:DNA repair protein RecN (Recombination protein N)
MIKELRIENLVVIERAELRLGAGLNAITGETGAGKTVLAHAIDLLLGGKARKGAVRPGVDEAWVEGVFELPDGLLDDERFVDLRERLPDTAVADRELTLARRVGADGRTRAFVAGRAASASDLSTLGCELVASLGQHQHRRLTLASAQRDLLDEFAGAAQRGLLARAHETHEQLRAARRQLEQLAQLDGRRERELGLIEFELEEIEALGPSVEDERELLAERDRLRAVDRLRVAAAAAGETLDGDGDASAVTLVAQATGHLGAVADADAEVAALGRRLAAAGEELTEATRDLRRYADELSADPARLQEVEERLDAYERLKRKHGDTVDTVLAHADRCRRDRELLVGADTQLGELRQAIERLQDEQSAICEQLTKRRRAAAAKLGKAVTAELAELALPEATFAVTIEPAAEGPGPRGADRVEFAIGLNPGISPAPLSETASGGELSRIMLALLTTVQSSAGGTFVFDEVDAGIGGHTARAVGARLRDLAQRHQVLCITHLPQVAAVAHCHFQIAKRRAGDATVAEVRSLIADEVVEELRRMMGGGEDDDAALQHARELLRAA